MSEEIMCEAFGRYWNKEDLKLLILALERGMGDIADITEDEYLILSETVKNIKWRLK